ncbi:MAG: N-formylglutamate deformylase [Gammaproteobacteria bacterium]|nr:N-formylglutamate deformylase [Gammaproteobacteria bacterium]NIR83453.1 N-formylglutamate deformylase [Gammaproteobacteria bacterium]NIR91375.1 N-formylglutamate deformylase [Gammaproteobacteria bacterium]NIU04615.1 N-formylglutamate deformylase [Gammaproteobacteria bacterium]NIV51657.1 N-formylglutamate deformylase [Gammaproteobacteria bacterium]
MEVYHYHEGSTPLLVSMPHSGTAIPEAIARTMTESALRVPDTDWHVERLYDFAPGLGAGVLQAIHSRYVIDLNRPPDDATLYPGQSNTGLCPTTAFDFSPLYREGCAPTEEEIARRLEIYWRPYHERLREALARIRERHGIAVLYEAHTIRSQVPRFFEGTLPDLNLGTDDGKSCVSELERALREILVNIHAFTHVVNGRFKGGYTTRAYGDPRRDVHAVQLELSQSTYMDEDYPFTYRQRRAARVRPVLRHLLEATLEWAQRRI